MRAQNTIAAPVLTLSGQTGILYINGAEAGRNEAMALNPFQLGRTDKNWLGRSRYAGDPLLAGKIDDFRLYSGALSPAEIPGLAAMAAG